MYVLRQTPEVATLPRDACLSDLLSCLVCPAQPPPARSMAIRVCQTDAQRMLPHCAAC